MTQALSSALTDAVAGWRRELGIEQALSPADAVRWLRAEEARGKEPDFEKRAQALDRALAACLELLGAAVSQFPETIEPYIGRRAIQVVFPSSDPHGGAVYCTTQKLRRLRDFAAILQASLDVTQAVAIQIVLCENRPKPPERQRAYDTALLALVDAMRTEGHRVPSRPGKRGVRAGITPYWNLVADRWNRPPGSNRPLFAIHRTGKTLAARFYKITEAKTAFGIELTPLRGQE